jgi:hypothetical protein
MFNYLNSWSYIRMSNHHTALNEYSVSEYVHTALHLVSAPLPGYLVIAPSLGYLLSAPSLGYLLSAPSQGYFITTPSPGYYIAPSQRYLIADSKRYLLSAPSLGYLATIQSPTYLVTTPSPGYYTAPSQRYLVATSQRYLLSAPSLRYLATIPSLRYLVTTPSPGYYTAASQSYLLSAPLPGYLFTALMQRNYVYAASFQGYSIILFNKIVKPLNNISKLNYVLFLSDNIALYFIDDDLINKILSIALILHKCFYYRHDFVALMSKFHKILKIYNIAIVFVLFLHMHTNFFSKCYAHRWLLICQYLIFKFFNQYYSSKIEHYSKSLIRGGGDTNFISSELFPYNDTLSNMIGIFKFHAYVAESMKLAILNNNVNLYECNIPLIILIYRLKLSELKLIASAHQIKYIFHVKINNLRNLILKHKCQSCVIYTVIFEFKDPVQKTKIINLKASKTYKKKHAEEYKISHLNSVKKHQQEHVEEYKISHLNSVKKHQQEHVEEYKICHSNSVKKHQQKYAEDYKKQNLDSVKKYQNKVHFPPEVLSKNLQHKIITDFVIDTSSFNFEESGCAVCGKLTLMKDLQRLSELDLKLEILRQKGVSQKERISSNDNLADFDGPIIEDNLDNICNSCYQSVLKGKLPQMALANGKWLGKIPTQLQDLSYAEQLIIARIRHNRCLV